MKRSTIIEMISFAFILLFLYVGISKFVDFKNTQFDFNQAPVIGRYPTLFATIIPLLEIATAICLFVPRWRKIGLFATSTLMIIFTVYVAYMLRAYTAYERPCSCGGIMRKLSWQSHLYFNIIATALSFFAIMLFRKAENEKPLNS